MKLLTILNVLFIKCTIKSPGLDYDNISWTRFNKSQIKNLNDEINKLFEEIWKDCLQSLKREAELILVKSPTITVIKKPNRHSRQITNKVKDECLAHIYEKTDFLFEKLWNESLDFECETKVVINENCCVKNKECKKACLSQVHAKVNTKFEKLWNEYIESLGIGGGSGLNVTKCENVEKKDSIPPRVVAVKIKGKHDFETILIKNEKGSGFLLDRYSKQNQKDLNFEHRNVNLKCGNDDLKTNCKTEDVKKEDEISKLKKTGLNDELLDDKKNVAKTDNKLSLKEIVLQMRKERFRELKRRVSSIEKQEKRSLPRIIGLPSVKNKISFFEKLAKV